MSDLVLRNICYRYPKTRQMVLHEINAKNEIIKNTLFITLKLKSQYPPNRFGGNGLRCPLRREGALSEDAWLNWI